MCQVFGVSKSGYYDRVQHEPSDRKQSDERLKLEIKVAHIRTRETYGTRRLQTELAENGIIVGRDRLARLRKELRLRCKQKRKFRATTNSNHNLPVAPNLLNQTFAPTAPNQVWVADLTYVATQEGWLYLAGIKDVHEPLSVSHSTGDDGRSLPKRRSTAPSMTSCTVSLLKPPVVTAQCSASRSQQSSANVTRSLSPLSQQNSNPSEHHR
ncbi:IS600 ORF2 [Shigella sonnei]|nr:IS600 ORF2 [Shigella sonnei]